MTHFKVSDEVVLAACTAYDRERAGEEMAEYPAMFHAIEAALPVMFDLAGWQFRLTHVDGFTCWSWAGDTEQMEWHKSLYVADEAGDAIEFRPLFAIKEPK